MAFSLLLHRRLCARSLLSFYIIPHKFNFRNSSSLETEPNPTPDPKPSSLSARMSFVFDQIDAIEKERSQKDDTLQRIRAWRESKKNKISDNTTTIVESESKKDEVKEDREKGGGLMKKAVELVHPWPEWIELMERLVQQNYFDHKRKDEDKMIQDLGFNMEEVADEGFDFTRDWKTVQTACLNFGKDRFDILRSLSRQDIQVLVGYGCPSADKKVVFSAKLLRKHVHLDEGDVCSSCSLRSSCERGYLLTNKEDEARTIDIMRVLLTYGFDPVNGSVVNESLLKIKSVKTVVRKLLHQVVKLSAVPIDPNLPPPVIKKPPPKVKQPPPPPRKRVGRDDIEMKKGDWLCPKCDFMNFAKNSVCLQCDANRPKRQLLPGEWECPECNFLNYRRNVVCFHCECKRPPDEFTENQVQERQRGPRTRPEKISSGTDVSNAWNFDFDDNESDGADVAAFEYADSHKLDENFPQAKWAEGENNRRSKEDFHNSNWIPRAHERENFDLGPKQPATGFDDFDDEEDDVESYEIDTQSGDQVHKTASVDFSELEVDSDGDDDIGTKDSWQAQRSTRFPRNNRASKPLHRKVDFSGSEVDELDFDSDKEIPAHPNWKSSHVADSGQRRNRGRAGAMSFGSDEDTDLSSGSDDDGNSRSRQNKGNKWGSSRRDFGKRARHDSEDFSDRGEDSQFRRGSTVGFDRRRNDFKGRGSFDDSENSRFKSRGMKGNNDRKSPFKDDFDRSSRGSRRNDRGFRRDDFDGRRKGAGRGNMGNFKSPKRENFGNRSTGDSYFDDERHRKPRENVR